jgi:regulator of sigma E protease
MIFLSYLIGLFGIGFLILIHEAGHFLFCKLFNIPAPKFAIGIGPTLFSKQYKKTEYSIGLIPIMGYVQIGEENNNSDAHILYQYPWIQGTLMTFGGIIFNLIFAYIAITSVIIWNSQYILQTNLKSFIPQKHIILEDKEKNQIILNYKTPIEVLQKIKKDEFTLEDHEGEKIIFENEKFFTNNFIIKYDSVYFPTTIFEKIILGITITNQIIAQSAYGILNLFNNGAHYNNISGPIGIMKQLSIAITKGLADFFIFLSLVSISLAVINLVPIPMLDGGQFLFLTIYKIIGKGVPDLIQTILTYGSLGLIILMTLFSTYNDILKVFFN